MPRVLKAWLILTSILVDAAAAAMVSGKVIRMANGTFCNLMVCVCLFFYVGLHFFTSHHHDVTSRQLPGVIIGTWKHVESYGTRRNVTAFNVLVRSDRRRKINSEANEHE